MTNTRLFLLTSIFVLGQVGCSYNAPNFSSERISNIGAKKPNILWIMTDQQRTDSLGCYGNQWVKTKIRTPNIDALAMEGTIFENCFIQSPICVPSRVSHLTSLYPNQNRVLYNTALVEWPEGAKAFPEIFAENGYVTANIGKVHTPPHDTWQYDERIPFDKAVPGFNKISPLFTDEMLQLIRAPKGTSQIDGQILSGIHPPIDGRLSTPTIAAADSAIKWLNSCEKEKPFLLRLSILAPHAPFLVPEPFYSMYDPNDMDFIKPSEKEKKAALYNALTEQQIRRMFATYYGLAAHVDAEVGRVIEALKNLGLYDNTIIVYESDHGHLGGNHGQMMKGVFYDEATRVPMIMRGPGVPSGKRMGKLTEAIDLAPTLMQLAGIEVPEQFRKCGKNMFGKDERDSVVGEIMRTRNYVMWVRNKEWSISFDFLSDGEKITNQVAVGGELYNIKSDPMCHENLYDNPKYNKLKLELAHAAGKQLGLDIDISEGIISIKTDVRNVIETGKKKAKIIDE